MPTEMADCLYCRYSGHRGSLCEVAWHRKEASRMEEGRGARVEACEDVITGAGTKNG